MIRAIVTHWNSLALAIGCALKLRRALVHLLAMPKYDQKGKKGLARFKLSVDEWLLLEQLHKMLVVCCRSSYAAALRLTSYPVDVCAGDGAHVTI